MTKKILILFIGISLLLPVSGFCGRNVVTKSITGQNSFSNAFSPGAGGFNISVSGTWTATVLIQRSFDNGTSWHTVSSHTANVELQAEEVEQGVLWRVGVATGGFGSGTVVVRLSQ